MTLPVGEVVPNGTVEPVSAKKEASIDGYQAQYGLCDQETSVLVNRKAIDDEQKDPWLLPEQVHVVESRTKPTNPPGRDLVWLNIIFFAYMHVGALVGLYMAATAAQWKTLAWFVVLIFTSAWSITAGCHRLWSHRSYKATRPVELMLLIWNCVAAQNSVIEWARDHRVHHKFTETDGDPHDSRRGFFFCHMGWMMMKKHPEVIRRGAKVDVSDLQNNPLLAFQHKHYTALILIFNYGLPGLIATALWGESPMVAFTVCSLLRCVCIWHCSFTINSLAHMYGYRDYDKNIRAADNYISCLSAFGEGFHNFHHAFPFDYRGTEFGWFINTTSMFLDTLALFGLIYDMKIVSQGAIEAKKFRTGAPHQTMWAWQHLGLP